MKISEKNGFWASAWLKALKAAGGDRQAAQAALSGIERRRLERDVARIWGKAHPFLAAPDTGRHHDCR